MLKLFHARSLAKEKGEMIGEARGEAQTLLKLFKLKFDPLPKSVEQKVNSAEKSQLEQWAERVLTADSIESLFFPD